MGRAGKKQGEGVSSVGNAMPAQTVWEWLGVLTVNHNITTGVSIMRITFCRLGLVLAVCLYTIQVLTGSP